MGASNTFVLGSGERERERRGNGTYGDGVVVVVFSSPPPSVTMSPFTVEPLHRGDLTVGLSQLDQSLSSNESMVRGVQEKRFGFLDGADFFCDDDEEEVCLETPGLSLFSFSLSSSSPMLTKRETGVGVSSAYSNRDDACGLAEEVDARIVSWFSSRSRVVDLMFPSMPRRYVPWPVMGSSPTVACRRSSMKVHSPVFRSSAICLTPLVC